MEVADAVQAAAEGFALAHGLADRLAHFLGVALREALVNAVRHGSGGDPSRRVKIRFRVERRALVLSVRDEGPGFDPSSLPAPLAPENLSRGGGRGIFLMHQFADDVSFTFPKGGGTLVRLRKRLPPRGRRGT